MSIGRAIILKTAALPWVERLVRKSALFRPLVSRFIAGDTLAEAIHASEQLCERGIATSLDYLGENVKSVQEAQAARDAYIEIAKAIAAHPQRDMMNISIKLTQCGFDQGDDLAEKHYRELLEACKPANTFVRIDMEDTRYTERTVAMLERVFPDYPNTGTVLQSYLYRSIDDLKRVIKLGARVRIVKGAYLEPKEHAYPSKADVDKKYVEMAKLALKEANYPAMATHDTAIIDELKAFIAAEKIDPASFEWQMIYGIRRDLQQSLKDEGFNMRVYIPYGDQWYPYFMRRLAERPANGLFFLKSLFKK